MIKQLFSKVITPLFLEIISPFKNQLPSILFWKILVYIIFFSIMFINIDITVIISGIGSILFAIWLIFVKSEEEEVNFWMPLTLLFWFFIFFIFTLKLSFYMSKWCFFKIIKPFNNWLDSLI